MRVNLGIVSNKLGVFTGLSKPIAFNFLPYLNVVFIRETPNQLVTNQRQGFVHPLNEIDPETRTFDLNHDSQESILKPPLVDDANGETLIPIDNITHITLCVFHNAFLPISVYIVSALSFTPIRVNVCVHSHSGCMTFLHIHIKYWVHGVRFCPR